MRKRHFMNEQLSKMKAAIEARVKAEPGNAGGMGGVWHTLKWVDE